MVVVTVSRPARGGPEGVEAAMWPVFTKHVVVAAKSGTVELLGRGCFLCHQKPN